jgi:lipoprotein-releasing system permease protein
VNPLAPFEWIVAIRFMREGLMQTLLIISGVALGVSVIVFISALISGLQSNLFRRTLDYQAQIVIVPPKELARALQPSKPTSDGELATLVQPRAQRLRSVDQWPKVRKDIERLPGVVVVSPVVAGAGFVVRGDANKSVSVTGIEPESYLRLIALNDKIVAGNPRVTSTDIVVGSELAKDLGVWIGDKLILQTVSGAAATLSVCGIFDFGNKGLNERSVYVALRTAQSLLGLAGGATSLEVNVADPFAAETIAQTIQAETGLQADSWIATNAVFFSALAAQSMSNTIIRFFVGLTAALGIASVLVVSVVQKSKEIGILRATGTSRRQILRLFLLQGALMGLMGSILGSAAGWAFLIAWRGIAKNADGTPLFIIEFDPMLFLYAAVGATLIGTLAAVFPAQQAARLDPAVAIRG